VEPFVGDLADPTSLAGLCDGVDTVLHLAGHISDDPGTCERVNAHGTEALVEQALAQGVSRLIYVSSAAVYGWAVHRGANEDEVTPAPATPVSRSRVRAERAILDVGGIVLRPLFVYGDGDTRFVPVVLRALRRLPFLIDRGEARISVVCVDDLAAAIAALAIIPGSGVSGAFHVSDGRPVAFRDLAKCLSQAVAVRLPRWSLPYPQAHLVMRAGAGRSSGMGVWSESVAHRLFLVARDHYYDSSAIWNLTGLQPGQPLEGRVGDLARWYGDLARHARREGPEELTRKSTIVGAA